MQKKSVTDEWIIHHLPKRTKKFIKEVEDFTFERGFMFTKRIAGHRLGYCTKCNRWVPLEMSGCRTVTPEMQTAFAARHNEPALCPNCHSPVMFKDAGADADIVRLKFLFVELQSTANETAEAVQKLKSKGHENAGRLAAGIAATLRAAADRMEDGHEN